MEVTIDLFSDVPQLTLRFANLDDLAAFLVGFWELI